MGGSSFSYSDWDDKKATYSSMSKQQIYNASDLDESLDPSKMKNGCRESCDSEANPNSTPIIIGLDCTGSMSNIPYNMIREGLGKLFLEIYTRKPVSDPHVLFCAIGDVPARDRAPFQVSQFESGCEELTSGLEKFWLAGCSGGGNHGESYHVPYYFAANMTKHDAYLKRGKKGFIFTIGDEPPQHLFKKEEVNRVFGYTPETDTTFDEIISQVSKTYIPFHIIIEEGSYVQSYGLDKVLNPWQKVLGENVVLCSDYTKLSEIITSILEVSGGVSKQEVIDSWDGSVGLVVSKAISGLTVNQEENSIVF